MEAIWHNQEVKDGMQIGLWEARYLFAKDGSRQFCMKKHHLNVKAHDFQIKMGSIGKHQTDTCNLLNR